MKLHATSEILATVILGLLALQSGCNLLGTGGDLGSVDWDVPFLLPEGTDATLPDSVQFEFVDLRDSRCPVYVDCVWEGDVQLDLILREPGGDAHAFLLAGYVPPEPGDSLALVKDTLGYRIGVLRVDPFPQTAVPDSLPGIGTFVISPSTP